MPASDQIPRTEWTPADPVVLSFFADSFQTARPIAISPAAQAYIDGLSELELDEIIDAFGEAPAETENRGKRRKRRYGFWGDVV